jgi:hypothetical protein
MAELDRENTHCLEDPKNVYAFYRKLGPLPSHKTPAELQGRMD